MQSENRLLEDLARLAGGAFSSFTTLKDEAEARLHEKLENILGRMDLVKRDEFDAVKAMAIKARTENADLAAQIKALEAKIKNKELGATSPRGKRLKTNKPTDKNRKPSK
jgi:BMFP domain-containing protein YqiC